MVANAAVVWIVAGLVEGADPLEGGSAGEAGASSPCIYLLQIYAVRAGLQRGGGFQFIGMNGVSFFYLYVPLLVLVAMAVHYGVCCACYVLARRQSPKLQSQSENRDEV